MVCFQSVPSPIANAILLTDRLQRVSAHYHKVEPWAMLTHRFVTMMMASKSRDLVAAMSDILRVNGEKDSLEWFKESGIGRCSLTTCDVSVMLDDSGPISMTIWYRVGPTPSLHRFFTVIGAFGGTDAKTSRMARLAVCC